MSISSIVTSLVTSASSVAASALADADADADAEIEKLAKKSIPQIFAEDGEDIFRAFETQVLAELGKQSGLVIATGGGAILRWFEQTFPQKAPERGLGKAVGALCDPTVPQNRLNAEFSYRSGTKLATLFIWEVLL